MSCTSFALVGSTSRRWRRVIAASGRSIQKADATQRWGVVRRRYADIRDKRECVPACGPTSLPHQAHATESIAIPIAGDFGIAAYFIDVRRPVACAIRVVTTREHYRWATNAR